MWRQLGSPSLVNLKRADEWALLKLMLLGTSGGTLDPTVRRLLTGVRIAFAVLLVSLVGVVMSPLPEPLT